MLLKPLSGVLAGGNPLYAVLKASAINHDGKTNRYALPGPEARTALVMAAREQGDIDPQSIGYVEVHALDVEPGTAIEAEALARA